MAHTATDISTDNLHLGDRGQGVARAGLIAAAIGLLLALITTLVERAEGGLTHFFLAYIHNYCFVLSLALGALFFVIIQHLTRAGWSVVVRRIAEVVAATMPLLAILFLPILIPVLFGMKEVYPWANSDVVAKDDLLKWKSAYLNKTFFVIRIAICFAVWIYLSRRLLNASVAQDESGDPEITRRLQRFSAPAVVAYGLTLTFFSFDVLMSLNPHWYSTMFGVYFFAGGVVGFNALLGLAVFALQNSGRLTKVVTLEHYHDLGKLVFAFVVFWTYIAFSQYMLQWYANIPEETVWYRARQDTDWWRTVSLTLLFGHFVLPFLLLISRLAKRRKALFCIGVVWVLLMHWLDVYWLVLPRVPHLGHLDAVEQVRGLKVADLGCLAGLGGLFLYGIVTGLRKHALIPQRDPRLPESLAFENF